MNIVLEILAAIANLATIAQFMLERWREHRHQRMTRK